MSKGAGCHCKGDECINFGNTGEGRLDCKKREQIIQNEKEVRASLEEARLQNAREKARREAEKNKNTPPSNSKKLR